jgi:hypothetical protein
VSFAPALIYCLIAMPIRKGIAASGLLILAWSLLAMSHRIDAYAFRAGGIRERLIIFLWPMTAVAALIAAAYILRREMAGRRIT